MSTEDKKEPRKATDLLIDIDNRLRIVEKRLAVFDFQQKLIINSLNKLIGIKQQEEKDNIPTVNVAQVKKPTITAAPVVAPQKPTQPASQSVAVEQEPKKESAIERKARLMHMEKVAKQNNEEYSFNLSNNIKTEKNQQKKSPEEDIAFNVIKGDVNNSALNVEAAAEESTEGPKVPVTQKASLYDGTVIALAEVVITNTITGSVKKLSTGNNGRWQTSLSPGVYTLNVNGKVGGEAVEYSQNFDVPPTDAVLDIPPPEVYKKRPKNRIKSTTPP